MIPGIYDTAPDMLALRRRLVGIRGLLDVDGKLLVGSSKRHDALATSSSDGGPLWESVVFDKICLEKEF